MRRPTDWRVKRVVVHVRIVTAQRQLETVLARQCAVTSALIAADFRHHWNHVIAETPGVGGLRILHVNRRGCCAAIGRRSNGGVAVA